MSSVSSTVVLGVHSYATPHFKTGIQFIAEGLAGRGVDVEYVSVPSSLLDVFGSSRRCRMARVWNRMGRVPVAAPMQGLREFAFPSLIPVHAALVKGEPILKGVRFPAAKHFSTRRFDLCVHDVGPTMAYLPLVDAKRYVLRLNDAPHGQSGLPQPLVEGLEQRLRDGFYDHVWAVSEPLAEYAAQVAPGTSVQCIPNGLDGDLFKGTVAREPGRKAVYMGSRTPWLDVDLLREAARLLPDWEFHCIGAGFEGERDAANLRFLEPVPHGRVPEVLAGYDVGLLPYADDEAHMDCVRRPLKYYEYVAAGLAVVSTDVGGLRQGLDSWAGFGDSPEEFARAVTASKPASEAAREAFMRDNDWSVRLTEMFGVLGGLG